MLSNLDLEFKRYLFLTRPYSWVSVAFAAVVANILANKAVNSETILLDVVFVITTWIFCNLMAEFFSKDMTERGKVNLLLPLLFFLISIGIIAFRNLLAIPFLVIILLSLAIYSRKNKSRIIGPISFFVRGLMELNLFVITLLFYNYNFNSPEWMFFGLVIYFTTCGRNLVGDIRDINFDITTLPKVFGITVSKVVVILLYLAAIFFVPAVYISPIIAILLIIFIKDTYLLHRLLVIVNTFILFELCILILSDSLAPLSYLVLIGILLNFLYNLVPRKSNPWKKFFL